MIALAWIFLLIPLNTYAFDISDRDLALRMCYVCHSKRGVIMKTFNDKSPEEIIAILNELKAEREDSVMGHLLQQLTNDQLVKMSEYLSEAHSTK